MLELFVGEGNNFPKKPLSFSALGKELHTSRMALHRGLYDQDNAFWEKAKQQTKKLDPGREPGWAGLAEALRDCGSPSWCPAQPSPHLQGWAQNG